MNPALAPPLLRQRLRNLRFRKEMASLQQMLESKPRITRIAHRHPQQKLDRQFRRVCLLDRQTILCSRLMRQEMEEHRPKSPTAT
jgi:hypothetical protein